MSRQSDRALKEGFEAVDPRAILDRVLALPIERWSYKGDPARHLGPMAQDFHAAFGLGADDRHIFVLDAGGVALAAIQGLHGLVEAQGARLEALEREVAALRSETTALRVELALREDAPSPDAGRRRIARKVVPGHRSPRREERIDGQTPAEPTPRRRSPRPEPERKPYDTPRLTQHGKLTKSRTPASGPTHSDRALKEGFEVVDPRAILDRVLALPIERWSYKGDPARHLGPMAQDFHAAFGLGADDRHIFVLDAGGVALAAIQGLHGLMEAQGARLEALEREMTALRAEATALRVELAVRESAGVA